MPHFDKVALFDTLQNPCHRPICYNVRMTNAYRYFPVTAAQKGWGLYVTCAGRHTVAPGDAFPSPVHPDEYFFSWERGRVLHEWQLILLEAGEGPVEFRHGTFAAKPGSLIVLPPGAWHRYRPDPRTGWTTDWIGFGGDFADRLAAGAGFGRDGAVWSLDARNGVRPVFAATVADLLASAESRPFAATASVPTLLAALAEAVPVGKESRPKRERTVRAQAFINDHLAEVVDFESLARSLGLSYRAFRYLFRKEVGVSPLQYQLERRLVRAKNLLASTDLPVKDIADALGFSSTWYFSHFFRKHAHLSPAAYRRRRSSTVLREIVTGPRRPEGWSGSNDDWPE